MIRRTHVSLRAGLALALGLGLALSASAQPADRAARLDARLDRLGERLSVTPQQAAALDALDADAGLWAASAAVRDLLTDAQLAQLRDARGARLDGTRRMRGDRAGARQGRRGEMRRRGARRSGAARGERARRTDAQRQAVRAVREDARTRQRDLVERLRAGTISDADFVAQTQALRESVRQRTQAARPADARRADRNDRREAARAARDQALGLTEAQKQQLQARRLDRIRNAPEPLDLRPFLDAEGQLDRAAYRQAQQARRQEQRAAAQARQAERPEILTQEQQDLVRIHRALAGGGGRRGGR